MKKNVVYLLILGLTYFISCDRPSHYPSVFQKVERLMPQHPDSALAFLEQVKNPESLSRKDKALPFPKRAVENFHLLKNSTGQVVKKHLFTICSSFFQIYPISLLKQKIKNHENTLVNLMHFYRNNHPVCNDRVQRQSFFDR